MICPANQAVYSTEIDSCSLSLYLQRTHAREMCKCTVIARQAPPRLECHGSLVLYYLAAPQLLHLQCQHNWSWQASTMRLEEAGFLKGTESCYLALQGLHSYPALRGARIPILFTPAVPAVASAEMEILRQMSFLNGTHLEELSSSIYSHHIEVDIHILFHLHASSLQHASKSNWIIWGLIVASIVLILFIIYYFTQVYIWNLLKNCFVDRDSTADSGI